MTAFILITAPSVPKARQRVQSVQLCLESYFLNEQELPALTPPCRTQEEVEEEFEDVIAEIRKKKEEAIAHISRDRKPFRR
jgi:hypothetical protein